MAKGFGRLNLIYLVGMALVLVGFILPMFEGALGLSLNGFDFINTDNFGTTTIAALLIFIGAAVGIVFCFVGGSNADLIKIIALLASIAGGVLILIAANDSWLAKMIGKSFWKNASIGTYMILAGWVVGVVGWIKK